MQMKSKVRKGTAECSRIKEVPDDTGTMQESLQLLAVEVRSLRSKLKKISGAL
jgi:hypothetical protein